MYVSDSDPKNRCIYVNCSIGVPIQSTSARADAATPYNLDGSDSDDEQLLTEPPSKKAVSPPMNEGS